MPFKFEKLEVWQLALEYVDLMDALANGWPRSEDYNLRSQLIRAATSIALNITEGSTGQTDLEQARFIGLALRSTIETVACQHLIRRRHDPVEAEQLQAAYQRAETLTSKLHALRKSLDPQQRWLRDEMSDYESAS